ncbi:MAG: endonuclease III [Deltaproteobacteria bacterium]|nr:endonuclease III [Deltaproteobacteria bacterium]
MPTGAKKRAPVTKATRKPARTRFPPDPARVKAVLRGLKKLHPNAECELHRENPFQLLVATILSAQCTDERVNKVTPILFGRFPTPQTLAEAPIEVLEDIVKPTGFYRQKAKNIQATARLICERHGGEVPGDLDAIAALPGAARKTANVVLGTAFDIAAGVVVDTHVQRLAMRLGLTRNTTPEKIEKDLMQVIPKANWIRLSHQLIWHGRRICFARKPACDGCALVPACPSAFTES